MAQEITVQSGIAVKKGVIDVSRAFSAQIDMAGDHYHYTVQDIPAADTAIGVGSVASPGMVAFRNMDGAATIEIGRTIGGVWTPFGSMLPGEPYGPVRWPAAGLHAKSSSGTVKMEVIITEL